MNDFQNFLLGKDWVITITIPNRLLQKHPDQVRVLQFVIESELQKFNAEIKKIDADFEKASTSIGVPQPKDEFTEEEKRMAVAKMEKDRRDRNDGGGRGTL